MPVPYCIYSVVQKWVFRPVGATHYPNKREIWHGRERSLLMPNFTFIGTELWEYSPQNYQIFTFWSQICPSGATSLHNFYEILTVCASL